MNIKKRYKRIISIILVLSMMITNLAGCGNGSKGTAQNQTDISKMIIIYRKTFLQPY